MDLSGVVEGALEGQSPVRALILPVSMLSSLLQRCFVDSVYSVVHLLMEADLSLPLSKWRKTWSDQSALPCTFTQDFTQNNPAPCHLWEAFAKCEKRVLSE